MENSESKKVNVWRVLAISFSILLIISWVNMFSSGVSKTEAQEKVEAYLKTLPIEGQVTVGNVVKDRGLYKLDIDIAGQKIEAFMSKDGSFLFPSAIDLTASPITSATTQETEPEEISKTAKPVVELFVMSFCPYGVKAENNIMPVIELLKDKIDFKVKFIVNVGGDAIDNVRSLHGIEEAKEDARQLAIIKYYSDKYYNYLKDFNVNCYPKSGDSAQLESCWKDTADKYGIDTSKIESVAYGSEGIEMLKANEADTSKYGVSGSPTLVINGVQSSSIYQGTEAVQSTICSAFTEAPTEWSTVVQASSTSAPSGSC